MKKQNELETQKETDLPLGMAQNVLSIIQKYTKMSELRKIGHSSSQEIRNIKAEKEFPSDKKRLQERNVDALSFHLFEYAQHHALDVHRKIASTLVEKSKLKHVVICGWDNNFLSSFKSIFFGDIPSLAVIDFSSEKTKLVDSHSLVFL